jgi:hypothetical protein
MDKKDDYFSSLVYEVFEEMKEEGIDINLLKIFGNIEVKE